MAAKTLKSRDPLSTLPRWTSRVRTPSPALVFVASVLGVSLGACSDGSALERPRPAADAAGTSPDGAVDVRARLDAPPDIVDAHGEADARRKGSEPGYEEWWYPECDTA